VAGHLAGHHAVAGAAIGCAVGHHQAKVKEKTVGAGARGRAGADQTGRGASAATLRACSRAERVVSNRSRGEGEGGPSGAPRP
jgi:hypothetical protein